MFSKFFNYFERIGVFLNNLVTNDFKPQPFREKFIEQATVIGAGIPFLLGGFAVVMCTIFSIVLMGEMLSGVAFSETVIYPDLTTYIMGTVLSIGWLIALAMYPLSKFMEFATYGQHSLEEYTDIKRLVAFTFGYSTVVFWSMVGPTLVVYSLINAWYIILPLVIFVGIITAVTLLVRKSYEVRTKLDEHKNNPDAHSNTENKE